MKFLPKYGLPWFKKRVKPSWHGESPSLFVETLIRPITCLQDFIQQYPGSTCQILRAPAPTPLQVGAHNSSLNRGYFNPSSPQ